MSGLSAEDREDLVNALLSTTDGFHRSLRVAGGDEEPLADVVEEIVARHVEAFREQAVAAIEAGVHPSHPISAYRDGFAHAAWIVQDLPR